MRKRTWSVFFVLALMLILRPAYAMAYGPPLLRAADLLDERATVTICQRKADGSLIEEFLVSVGDKLEAVVDNAQEDAEFTYQWYRNDPMSIDDPEPIPEANGEVYRAAPEDAGMVLRVQAVSTNYSGELMSFTISVRKYLGNAEVTLFPSEFEYNGEFQKPDAEKTVVKIGEQVLKMGEDYKAPPFRENSVNAGTYAAVVEPLYEGGEYSGQAYGYYTIEPATPVLAIEPSSISLAAGASHTVTPMLTGVKGENVLDSGRMEYISSDPGIVSVEDGVLTAQAVGTATITAAFRRGERSNYKDSDSVEITVHVAARGVSGIALAELPRTAYEYGQPFDPAGLVLTVTYNNGQTEIVRWPDEGIAWSPADLGGVGDKTVTVSFGGASVELPITVIPAVPEGQDAVYDIKYDDLTVQTVPAAGFGISLPGRFTLGDMEEADRALLGMLKAGRDTISFAMKEDLPAEALTVSIPVVFHPDSENYRDRELTLTVRVSVKQIPVLTASGFRRPYNGEAVTMNELLDGLRAVCGGEEVQGTWSAASPLPVNACGEAYSCQLVFTPDALGEYEAGAIEVSITIDPAEVIVAVEDKEVPQGGGMPELTYTVAGLLGGDTLLEEPLLDCEARDTSRAGTFPITASGADAGGNYTIVYRSGTLTVKAPAPSETVRTPVASPVSGTSFADTLPVTLTCGTEGADIYYTLDGSVPTASSTRYTGPVRLAGTSTLRAVAVKGGMLDSAVMTAVYIKIKVDPPQPDLPSQPAPTPEPEPIPAPEAPSEPAPPAYEDPTRPEAAVDGGTARVDFTASTAEKLVEQALENKDGTLVIAPVITGDAARTEMTLPAAAASNIAAWTRTALKVETPAAEITIPSGSLARLGGPKGEITIAAGRIEEGVEVEITVDGKPVEHLPIKAAVSVPCGPGTVAQVVDEKGNVLSVVRKSSASGDGQTMTVSLDGPERVVFREGGRTFTDISTESWAADAVAFVSSRQLMGEGDAFRPGEAVTRAMLSAVLYNLEGSPASAYAGGFRDVPEDAWYAGAVRWAAEQGVVTGVIGGNFDPGAPVTREQLAAILYQYAGRPDSSGDALDGFRDAGDVSAWTARALSWAVSQGIINGDNGALRPRDSATRAETAQMLMHLVSGGEL